LGWIVFAKTEKKLEIRVFFPTHPKKFLPKKLLFNTLDVIKKLEHFNSSYQEIFRTKKRLFKGKFLEKNLFSIND
jgi:hypothetical protein